MSDARNQLNEAYLELSDRACAADIDGLMNSSGWDLHAVGRYLACHEDLIRDLMLIAYLRGGEPRPLIPYGSAAHFC